MKTFLSQFGIRRVATRTLSLLGINRRLQCCIRDGIKQPVKVFGRIVTYDSALQCFITLPAADWILSGCGFTTLSLSADRHHHLSNKRSSLRLNSIVNAKLV